MPKPHKQVAAETLPHRQALASIVGGDASRRSMNAYAKATPLDASGQGIADNPQLPTMSLAATLPSSRGSLFR